jgi:hypothetical protein
MLCPICKNSHELDELIQCDQKVTRKLSKYKSIDKKKLLKEFKTNSKIECVDCSRKSCWDWMIPCLECKELLCQICSGISYTTQGSLCKTCFGDKKLAKCKFCKSETDMFRPCVKCYEQICWSCIIRCKGCNQIICPHCDVFNRVCMTCSDEKHFYLKFKNK